MVPLDDAPLDVASVNNVAAATEVTASERKSFLFPIIIFPLRFSGPVQPKTAAFQEPFAR